MLLEILAVFILISILICVAFDFVHSYNERKRQQMYLQMVKFRNKPIILDEAKLKRIGDFWNEWERQKEA